MFAFAFAYWHLIKNLSLPLIRWYMMECNVRKLWNIIVIRQRVCLYFCMYINLYISILFFSLFPCYWKTLLNDKPKKNHLTICTLRTWTMILNWFQYCFKISLNVLVTCVTLVVIHSRISQTITYAIQTKPILRNTYNAKKINRPFVRAMNNSWNSLFFAILKNNIKHKNLKPT